MTPNDTINEPTNEPTNAPINEPTVRTDADDEARTEQTGPVPPPLPPPPPPGSRPSWQRTPVARDPDNGKLGGVIAGISRSYGFDVRTTRIAVVVATIVLPVLIVAYGAAWLLLPERPDRAIPMDQVVRDRRKLPLLIALGIVLVAGGIGSFGSWFLFGGLPWGLGLIAIGVLLWAAPNLVADRGPAPASPPTPGAGPLPADARWTAPLVPGDAPAPSASTASTATTTTTTTTAPSTSPSWGAPMSTLPPLVERPRRRRYPIDAVGFMAASTFALVAAGGDALDWWNLPILHGVFVVLAILWGSHLVSGIVNRRWSVVPGLLFLGAVSTAFLVTQPNLDGGVGEERVRPLTVAEAGVRQQLGMGELTIDLTDVADVADATANASYTVRAEVGVGRLRVIVPEDVVLELRSRVGAGHLVLDGDEIVAGLDHRDTHRDVPAVTAPDGQGTTTIVLDVEIGAGEISIDRVDG